MHAKGKIQPFGAILAAVPAIALAARFPRRITRRLSRTGQRGIPQPRKNPRRAHWAATALPDPGGNNVPQGSKVYNTVRSMAKGYFAAKCGLVLRHSPEVLSVRTPMKKMLDDERKYFPCEDVARAFRREKRGGEGHIVTSNL